MKYGTVNSRDETLLRRLEQIVLENLQNEQFSVEVLASIIGMSRSHLHRKLKLLKGKSISKFVREVKLKEAMKLLQHDVVNVSEAAYRVGFSSTSYFNTCFHDYYGYPPGEVKKRNQYQGRQLAVQAKEKHTLKDDTQISNDIDPKHQKPFWQKAVVIWGILLAIVLLSTYYLFPSKTVGVPGKFPAIAILPLDHLSDRPDQEYLTAGIHDALIGELGAIKGLRVISRTSTLRYPNSDLLIQDIAKELGVNVIIEGSVLITGDSLRLQLQLIKPFPQESHIWAQEYYREVPDILSLQSNVIKDIAESIEVSLSANDRRRLNAKKHEIDPETYKAYLRGMYFLNKSTPEDFKKGLDYLHQAIEKDPANPHAYAGLAEGYITLLHGPNPSRIYWQRAKAAATRAIELDSTLAKAHATLAMIKLYHENDWQGVEDSFANANNLNPNLAYNHFHYSWYNIIIGKTDIALKEQRLAKELDPLTTIFTADMGSMYYWFGQYDKAMVELKQALELDSEFGHTWWMLGNVYTEKGKYDEAIKAHKKAVTINPVWKWALANTYVRSGNRDQALSVVAELKTKPITPRIAFGLTLINVSLGNLDEAFYWLDFQPSDVWVPWIRTWPGFELMREDPRFDAFLKKKDLPPVNSAT